MGRKAGIWYRKQNETWYVKINGKQINLGKDKAAAEKEFHRLKSCDIPRHNVTNSVTAAEILDKFLLWVGDNKAQGTLDWYEKHLQAFLDSLPNQRIEADKIRPHHVTDWCKSSWSKSYTRGAMIALQRAFKWATKQGYLDRSPLEHLEKPSAERRDNCPTQADFDAILELATEPFKSVLQFCYETGCRPQEVIAIEPRHVKDDRVEFPVTESKGKKRKRVIYLTDKAKAILGRANGQFANSRGRPWTAFSMDCRLKKIAKKTGKKYSMTDLRHFFCDRMIMAGLDHTVVAGLMGHSNTQMVSSTYNHISQRNEFLLDKLKSVQ